MASTWVAVYAVCLGIFSFMATFSQCRPVAFSCLRMNCREKDWFFLFRSEMVAKVPFTVSMLLCSSASCSGVFLFGYTKVLTVLLKARSLATLCTRPKEKPVCLHTSARLVFVCCCRKPAAILLLRFTSSSQASFSRWNCGFLCGLPRQESRLGLAQLPRLLLSALLFLVLQSLQLSQLVLQHIFDGVHVQFLVVFNGFHGNLFCTVYGLSSKEMVSMSLGISRNTREHCLVHRCSITF